MYFNAACCLLGATFFCFIQDPPFDLRHEAGVEPALCRERNEKPTGEAPPHRIYRRNMATGGRSLPAVSWGLGEEIVLATANCHGERDGIRTHFLPPCRGCTFRIVLLRSYRPGRPPGCRFLSPDKRDGQTRIFSTISITSDSWLRSAPSALAFAPCSLSMTAFRMISRPLA